MKRMPVDSNEKRLERILALDDKDAEFLSALRQTHQSRAIQIERPDTAFPELFVTVPDEWDSVQLAPLYDVHIGAHEHDEEMFDRHLLWMANTPNVITFGGGDLIENASKMSVGASVFGQTKNPHQQVSTALKKLSLIQHKIMFTLPGNHEDRMDIMGENMASWLATMLGVPYFADYCFCSIRWRGNNFRILAHHGTTGAATAGAQRMAARKDISWARPFDLFWTGHLHQPIVDVLYQTDQDQKSGLMFERNGFVIISPSYLKYFGGYGAKKRYAPGTRGLGVVELQADGRLDSMVHANGRRL